MFPAANSKWLDNNWDKVLFGGNAGLWVDEDDNCVGIIKYGGF